MGFGGARALILVAILVALILAVTKFDLPGWILPVGLIGATTILEGTVKSQTA